MTISNQENQSYIIPNKTTSFNWRVAIQIQPANSTCRLWFFLEFVRITSFFQNHLVHVRYLLRLMDLTHQYAAKFRLPHHNWRSEEHTSELQSRENLVCRL